MARITLNNLTKHFGTVRAVEQVNLDIADRSFVTLLGPSGCGKSTTLYMVAGLEAPTSGEILFDDQSVTYIPARERDIAMVFQNYALYPHMTVRDNMSFHLRLKKFRKDVIQERVDKAAKLLNIEQLLQRKPSQISGGQQQRAALGRAIVRQPTVYLMDEPLSNLDAEMRVIMRAELKLLQRELNVTTVFVTHDQEEAMSISDKIAVMSMGELQQYAEPDEIYNRPRNLFVAGFIGSPKMNMFEGTIRTEGDTYFLRSDNYELALGQKVGERLRETILPPDVVLGVRSEDVQLKGDEKGSTLRGHIDLLQPVGPITYVEVLLEQDVKLIASTTPGEFIVGQKVGVSFIPQKIHFFEKWKGERLPV